MRQFPVFALILALLGLPATSLADACTQRSHVMPSSGGSGTSTHFVVHGTLGQPSPPGSGMAVDKVQYAGFMASWWNPSPVRLRLTATCPPDRAIPRGSTIPRLTLTGFAVTNASSIELCVAYHVSSSGPATLVNNGYGASLSGYTPPLVPGQTFWPPEAALEIPAIYQDTHQYIHYVRSAVALTSLLDSCVTTIDYVAPVPVLITSVRARALTEGVELSWEVADAEEIAGFQILRGHDSAPTVPVQAGLLLPRDDRQFLDTTVRPGIQYEYTLVAVEAEGTTLQSQPVRVRAKAIALSLEQNYPNPFNPRTTITFGLPEPARVSLSIYDVTGRLVRTLVDEVRNGGIFKVEWDGTNQAREPVSSGVYICRLKTGHSALNRKMVLLK